MIEYSPNTTYQTIEDRMTSANSNSKQSNYSSQSLIYSPTSTTNILPLPLPINPRAPALGPRNPSYQDQYLPLKEEPRQKWESPQTLAHNNYGLLSPPFDNSGLPPLPPLPRQHSNHDDKFYSQDPRSLPYPSCRTNPSQDDYNYKIAPPIALAEYVFPQPSPRTSLEGGLPLPSAMQRVQSLTTPDTSPNFNLPTPLPLETELLPLRRSSTRGNSIVMTKLRSGSMVAENEEAENDSEGDEPGTRMDRTDSYTVRSYSPSGGEVEGGTGSSNGHWDNDYHRQQHPSQEEEANTYRQQGGLILESLATNRTTTAYESPSTSVGEEDQYSNTGSTVVAHRAIPVETEVSRPLLLFLSSLDGI